MCLSDLSKKLLEHIAGLALAQRPRLPEFGRIALAKSEFGDRHGATFTPVALGLVSTDGFDLGGVAKAVQQHVDSCPCEGLRDPQPDAARGTGDDGGFPLQPDQSPDGVAQLPDMACATREEVSRPKVELMYAPAWISLGRSIPVE